MTKRTIIATAASIFAAGGLVTAAHAQSVKCSGTNACPCVPPVSRVFWPDPADPIPPARDGPALS